MIFYSVFAFVLAARFSELLLARRNERLMRDKGAYEVGASHYPFMILLHAGFLVSLLLEVQVDTPPNMIVLFVFFLLQLARIWCIRSLGLFWNTKILILPSARLVATGPYAYIRHPNYLIVCLEILVLPLVFHAYMTAAIFTCLNLWMLSVRIPLEDRMLKQNMNANDMKE